MYVPHSLQEPGRAELDALGGPAIIEFGSRSCGICRAAQPAIEAAQTAFPRLPYIKVEDGRGRPLGRSFGVRLWPTLVFMLDGRETARLVRPTGGAIADAFAELARLSAHGAPTAAKTAKATASTAANTTPDQTAGSKG
jgi:thioredoxin 1